jgi:protein O-mannosyl-transferase
MNSQRAYYLLRLFVVLFLVALLAYSTIINSFFLSDDFAQIGKVLNGDLSFTWGEKPGGFFRPLFILSYALDGRLWGINPVGYHITNITLHVLVSLLVVLLSAELMQRTGYENDLSSSVSVAAGLIFVVLPSHTEAVSWISGRADLLATLFCVAALISYLMFTRKRRMGFLFGTVAFFAIAMLSKESAVCLPFICIAIELCPAIRKRPMERRQVTLALVLLFITVLVYVLIRYAVLGAIVGGYGTSLHLNFKFSLIWERLPKYVIRAVLPPLPERLSFVLVKPFRSRAFIVFAVLFVAAVGILLAYRHKLTPSAIRKQQNGVLLLLLVLFLCALFPVIMMGISVFDTSGERFLYLPSVFTSIAVAYTSVILIANRRVWFLSTCCLLLFYSVSLHASNQRWRDAADLTKSLLDDCTSQSTRTELLVMNVPDSLRGVPLFRNGLEQALMTFQHAARISRVDVVSTHSLQSTDDVEIQSDSTLFTIQLSGVKEEFTRINDALECVEVVGQNKRSMSIRLTECAKRIDVFYFRDGRMIKS